MYIGNENLLFAFWKRAEKRLKSGGSFENEGYESIISAQN